MTSDSLPLDGGVMERRSTAILSSVGEGVDEDDSVAIGGRAIAPTGRGWGGKGTAILGGLGYAVCVLSPCIWESGEAR